jgi:hypothetical protein
MIIVVLSQGSVGVELDTPEGHTMIGVTLLLLLCAAIAGYNCLSRRARFQFKQLLAAVILMLAVAVEVKDKFS